MGQTTDQIENQIENKREDLKSNLQELETRVKTATDWRHYFAEHTGTAAVFFWQRWWAGAATVRRGVRPAAPRNPRARGREELNTRFWKTWIP